MRRILVAAVLFSICLVSFIRAQNRTVRIQTARGGVNIELPNSNFSNNVDVRIVLDNIQSRLLRLERIANQDTNCDRLVQPIVYEIIALINLLPQDIYFVPISTEVIYPMDDYHFAQFLSTLENESFSDDKLLFLRQVSTKNFFTCEQLGKIIDKFTFSDDKLEAVKILKSRLVDPENAFTLKDNFTFDSDKNRFMEIIYSE